METVGQEGTTARSGVTRRDFLKVAGAAPFGLASGTGHSLLSGRENRERSVIFLMLVGGPSQLDTFDPKPDAPSEVRGPFRSIATAVPGVRVCEHLPELARRLDRVTLVRSLSHDAAPIHETGAQLIQTGRLSGLGQEYPHFGSVAARMLGSKNGLPPFAVLPKKVGNTGVSISRGQTAGILGESFEPVCLDSETMAPGDENRELRKGFDLNTERASLRDRYGRGAFGENCLRARRLVEAGVRVVTVNMYETVFQGPSWDCHGMGPFSTLDDYAREVLPTFDRAYSALLDDLSDRGLLSSTLVVATGEFGRTPRLNASGGRDHWPGVWSAVLAGGGTGAGQVIGASDAHGTRVADRPVHPKELVATIYESLGMDSAQSYTLESGEAVSLIDRAEPLREAFV